MMGGSDEMNRFALENRTAQCMEAIRGPTDGGELIYYESIQKIVLTSLSVRFVLPWREVPPRAGMCRTAKCSGSNL